MLIFFVFCFDTALHACPEHPKADLLQGEFCGVFIFSGGSAATLKVLLPLPFALFLSQVFFFFVWHHGN